jgi:hypothetical protein
MRRRPGGAKWRNGQHAGCGWYLTSTTRCFAWTGSDDHPAVIIGVGNGWWQAVIPEPDGEIVTTRYTLRALLDKLDELLDANPGHD